MTKKITAIFLALCMAISVLPMTIQAASKPDIKAVSYTHLDVYKRQIQICVTARDIST